jgi:hypothetical protein
VKETETKEYRRSKDPTVIMWLLNTTTCELSDITGQNIPPYAILSHTWSSSEVLFRDMETFPISVSTMQKPGFSKVSQFCKLAKSYGFEYGWVDSCCIDKRSSAELSEAINSMYAWYRDAGLCIVYLHDVPHLANVELDSEEGGIESRTWVEAFQKSRWFTRGWTLQELIAPRHRLFFVSDWTEISPTVLSAQYKIDLLDLITSITNIPIKILRDGLSPLSYCIATRMSWASSRITTRPEDGAYCLLGLFNASIPILYGEGLEKAFARLQEEIMKGSFDQTLFVWRGPYESSGLLAHYPSDFANTPQLEVWGPDMLAPYYMTNTGLYIQACVFKEAPGINSPAMDEMLAVLQCDVKTEHVWKHIMVQLQCVNRTSCLVNGEVCIACRRVNCDTLIVKPFESYSHLPMLVLEDRHSDLVQRALQLHDRRWATRLVVPHS